MMQAMKDRFVEITDMKRDYNYIWNLVDAGYPVYFVNYEHIETCFPREEAFNFDKKKYFIGAGSSVNYKKPHTGFINNGGVRIFIFLDYIL
jgi:hypothetical protein